VVIRLSEALVQIYGMDERPLCEIQDFKLTAPQSRWRGQLGPERPNDQGRTALCGCDVINAGNRHGRALEDFEAEHRNNTRRHTPVVLFDHVVEVF
jgi:hypothetical protein